MKSKKETLIATLRGSTDGLRQLSQCFEGVDIYDETGHVDTDFFTQILQEVNTLQTVVSTTMDLLMHLLAPETDALSGTSQKDKRGGEALSVEEVLKRCEYRDGVLYLPKVQLSKKAYADVKLWIEEAGGKWKGGKVQGFTFDFNADRVVGILRQGKRCNLAQEFQFFETPGETADWLVSLVGEISPEMKILEPSAGRGAIVRAVHRVCPEVMVDCYELMPENKHLLMREDGVRIIGDDFTKEEFPDAYDIIVANPPFSKNQDIRHVQQMYTWLKPQGVMAAITSRHWLGGSERECVKFRGWLDEVDAALFDIPKGTFKQSGTGVGTIAIVIVKDK